MKINPVQSLQQEFKLQVLQTVGDAMARRLEQIDQSNNSQYQENTKLAEEWRRWSGGALCR